MGFYRVFFLNYRKFFLMNSLYFLEIEFGVGRQNHFSIEQSLFAYTQSQFGDGGGCCLGTGDRFIPTTFKKLY
jgi:hypothetical protein